VGDVLSPYCAVGHGNLSILEGMVISIYLLPKLIKKRDDLRILEGMVISIYLLPKLIQRWLWGYGGGLDRHDSNLLSNWSYTIEV
jgi:hypothetical protein